MLIQITNRCQEGCRHCLQNSLPDGPHMTEAMFKRTLAFGKFLRCMTYVISGGEPTEHPQFYDFCKMLNNFISKNGNKAAFTVVSNGMWYPEQVETMQKLARLEHYAGMQVYTNQQWYKDYDFIMAHKEDLEAIEKVKVDTEPLQMQDLGRARFNEDAQLEVAKIPTTCHASTVILSSSKYRLCVGLRECSSTERCASPSSISEAMFTCRSHAYAHLSET